MTKDEALKLAHDALEKVTSQMLTLKDELAERGARPITNIFHQKLWDSSFKAYADHALPAAIAIKEALAQDDQLTEKEKIIREMTAEIVAARTLAQPEHNELQARGEHPAPCARHCEATAFQIVIRGLKAQLAQPAQEPVVFYRCNGCDHAYEGCPPTSCDCMAGTGFERVEYFTTPPKEQQSCDRREWVGLTDEEVSDFVNVVWPKEATSADYIRAIAAKLKEKNT